LIHNLTMLAYVLHVGGGAVGLGSGLVAAIARKGGFLHRRAGRVFVVSMLVMATFAAYLAVAVPDQIVNLFIERAGSACPKGSACSSPSVSALLLPF